jgi:hypothetical protein
MCVIDQAKNGAEWLFDNTLGSYLLLATLPVPLRRRIQQMRRNAGIELTNGTGSVGTGSDVAKPAHWFMYWFLELLPALLLILQCGWVAKGHKTRLLTLYHESHTWPTLAGLFPHSLYILLYGWASAFAWAGHT